MTEKETLCLGEDICYFRLLQKKKYFSFKKNNDQRYRLKGCLSRLFRHNVLHRPCKRGKIEQIKYLYSLFDLSSFLPINISISDFYLIPTISAENQEKPTELALAYGKEPS